MDYFEMNNSGYISQILLTLQNELKNTYYSDDYLHFGCGSTGTCVEILCKHSKCLNKYKKYNTNN